MLFFKLCKLYNKLCYLYCFQNFFASLKLKITFYDSLKKLLHVEKLTGYLDEDLVSGHMIMQNIEIKNDNGIFFYKRFY